MTAPPLLRGPSNPDIFRASIHGARWYRDTLPADGRWTPMPDPVPAVTTLKKAWSKPFRKKTPTGVTVPLDAYRAAEFVIGNLADLTLMHPEHAFGMIATAPDRDLSKAADRGTALHTVMEAYAIGQQPAVELLDEPVKPFIDACEAFVAEWRPVWHMTEVVVFNRAIGFAGTADALIELPGIGLCLVDWKSRGSGHGAYPEEACQLGGYASADYFIVQQPDGTLERIEPPECDAGAVVSITADDGYRVYPIDIVKARRAFLGMFETWRIRRAGEMEARQAIGLPLPQPDDVGNTNEQQRYGDPKTNVNVVAKLDHQSGINGVGQHHSNHAAPTGVEPESLSAEKADHHADHRSDECNVDYLKHRVTRIVETLGGRPLSIPWPPGVPTFKTAKTFTAGELFLIDQWCWGMESLLELPFPYEPPIVADAKGFEKTDATDEPDQESQGQRDDSVSPHPPDDSHEQWASKGKALLSLLDDEPLARACAAVAHCDAVKMTRIHYLALQAVVTQVSDSAGVVVAYWSGSGPEIRAVDDMEAALIAAMPVDGGEIKGKRTKREATRRARNVAKRLRVPAPRSYEQLCDDLLLACCVAVGHGVYD